MLNEKRVATERGITMCKTTKAKLTATQVKLTASYSDRWVGGWTGQC